MPVAGSITYRLTLDSETFLKNLAKATAAWFAFKASLKAISDPFAEGFRLRILSKETNQSISDLVKLQWGAKAVGLETEQVNTILVRFQRALGGVTREGIPLQFVIQMLGLNIRKLQQMSATDAFMNVANAVKGLNANSAAYVMTRLVGGFGAMGAGALAMARAMPDVAEGMRRAAVQGAVWEKFAYTFYQIERRVTLIVQTLKGFTLGLASGMAPGLLHLLRELDNFLAKNQQAIVNFGQKVGSIMNILAATFKEGKIGEFLKASFLAAAEALGNALFRIMATVGAGINAMIYQAMSFLGQLIKSVVMDAVDVFKIGILNARYSFGVIDKGEWEAETALVGNQAFLRHRANTGGMDMKAVTDAMAEMWKMGKDFFGTKNQDAFRKFYEAMSKVASKFLETEAGPPGADKGNTLGAIYRLPISAIEKIGFTFGGKGITGLSDWNRQTAQNTSKMVSILSTAFPGGRTDPSIHSTRGFMP